MIKEFNGDLEELRELILNSWHKKFSKKFIHDYKIPFLEWNLKAPERDPELQIGYYKKGKLTGFLASLPRIMAFDGKKGKYNITAFFSVDQNYRGFTAYRLAKEFNRRYPLLKYNAVFYYIEEQAKVSEEVIKANFKRDKINYDITGETYFLMKIFDYKRASKFTDMSYLQKSYLESRDRLIYKPECPGTIRYYNQSEDLKKCLNLLNNYEKHLKLARLWSEEELAWQLYYPGVSNTLIYEDREEIKGLLNYHIMDIIKGEHEDRLAKIDNIYFGKMKLTEKKRFLLESMDLLKNKEDVGGVTIFYNPYFHLQKKKTYNPSTFLNKEDFKDDLFGSLNFQPDEDKVKIYVIIFDGKSYKDVFPFYLDYK